MFSFEQGRLLSDLISIICPIRIDPCDDGLPKSICGECKEIVMTAINLRETSVKNDIVFRSQAIAKNDRDRDSGRMNIKNEFSAENFTIYTDPLSKVTDFDEESYPDFEDNISFDLKLNQIKKKCGSTSKAEHRYQCPYKCGQTFTRSANVDRHIQRRHIGNDSCSYCTFKFNSLPKLIVHQKSCTGFVENRSKFKYLCDLCSRIFTTKAGMETHIKCHRIQTPKNPSQHTSKEKFPCDLCPQTFTLRRNVLRHKIRLHSKDLPYPCSFCNCSFSKKNVFVTHMNRYHSEEEQMTGLKQTRDDHSDTKGSLLIETANEAE